MFVITGATGHIGSQTAEILLAQGARVRVIGRSAERLEPLVKRGAEAAVGDLRDQNFLSEAFGGARALFAMIPPDHAARDFRADNRTRSGRVSPRPSTLRGLNPWST